MRMIMGLTIFGIFIVSALISIGLFLFQTGFFDN